jgi:hypothetical protein
VGNSKTLMKTLSTVYLSITDDKLQASGRGLLEMSSIIENEYNQQQQQQQEDYEEFLEFKQLQDREKGILPEDYPIGETPHPGSFNDRGLVIIQE